jgi:hypothetical protein
MYGIPPVFGWRWCRCLSLFMSNHDGYVFSSTVMGITPRRRQVVKTRKHGGLCGSQRIRTLDIFKCRPEPSTRDIVETIIAYVRAMLLNWREGEDEEEKGRARGQPWTELAPGASARAQDCSAAAPGRCYP